MKRDKKYSISYQCDQIITYDLDGDEPYLTKKTGYIYTKHGIVSVEGWKWLNDIRVPERIDLSIIINGKLHVRRLNKFYSDRYLKTLSKRFANEVNHLNSKL